MKYEVRFMNKLYKSFMLRKEAELYANHLRKVFVYGSELWSSIIIIEKGE